MNNKLSRRVVARAYVEKIIAEPARQKHWTKVLAAYLVEQKMIDTSELLINDILHEYAKHTGELLVHVTSARTLSETMRAELTRALHEATAAKHIVLTEHVDADLIGGVVAQTPDAVLDTSVQSQLKQLAAIK